MGFAISKIKYDKLLSKNTIMSKYIPIFGENPEDINKKLSTGGRLATELVDHLESMGASSCQIPVLDRAKEMIVIVMSKEDYDKKNLI